MSHDVDPAQDELRRAQRRQIHAIGASAVSVVALVAVTVLGVHSWRDGATRHAAALGSSDVRSTSQPLASAAATSQLTAAYSELALGTSPPPIASTPPVTSPSPSPTARPTPSPTDRNVSGNGQVNLKLAMTASPTRVVFGQPVRVTLTILNAGGVDVHTGQLGVGTMRPTDTFNEVPPACEEPQPGGVWCSPGVLKPGQRMVLSFSITSTSAPFSDDLVFANLDYLDTDGQHQDQQIEAPELTVIDDPGNWPPASPASAAPPPISAPPSISAPPGTPPSTP